MKKIYAIALLAMAAAGANAQNGAPLYITGEGFEPKWSAVEPLEFKWDAATSLYSIDAENLTSFAISTGKGTTEDGAWDIFNAGRMQANTVDMNGEWANLEAGTGNILAPYPTVAPSKGKIEVKGDLSQIRITMESAKDSYGVYVRGGMNGWLNEDWDTLSPKWQLKAENDTTYYINFDGVSIKAGEPFKIADKGWAWVNFGCGDENKEPKMLDVPSTLDYNGGNNITLDEDCTGSIVIVFSSQSLMDPATVTFSNDPYKPGEQGGVEGVVVDGNEAAEYYNLQGVRVNDARNGLYIVVKGGKAQKVMVK